jgi:hypothetical protein
LTAQNSYGVWTLGVEDKIIKCEFPIIVEISNKRIYIYIYSLTYLFSSYIYIYIYDEKKYVREYIYILLFEIYWE